MSHRFHKPYLQQPVTTHQRPAGIPCKLYPTPHRNDSMKRHLGEAGIAHARGVAESLPRNNNGPSTPR